MGEYVKDMRERIGSRPLVVPGATIIVQAENNEILMQRRSDSGEWGLPGGALEPGESLEETAARELFEETSLTAEHFRFVNMLSGQALYYQYSNGDEVYNLIAVYAAEGASGTAGEHDEESLETAYFPLDRLPEEIDPRAVLVLDCFTGKHG